MATLKDTEHYVSWEGGLNIDADGAPNAYGPPGSSPPGLDYLANAGHPGNWYGVLVDEHGDPIIQKMSDPCPGMYISPTSLVDHGYGPLDPRRYVDSLQVPYLAVAKDVLRERGVKLGDVGFAYNRATQKLCAAVVADAGPRGKYGEGSIALARALGVPNTSPKNGGASAGIVCVVFKGSSRGWPRPAAEINDQVELFLQEAGGLAKFL